MRLNVKNMAFIKVLFFIFIILNVNLLLGQDIVKLVFVHHSTGRYWLNSGHGNLGDSLAANNYYVRDTDYGWDAPNNTNIGDYTDIGQWYLWFADSTIQDNGNYKCDNVTAELFITNTKYASYSSPIEDPGGENEIIMFKSCFPNSNIREENGTIPEEFFGQPYTSTAHTLNNCKALYNEILNFFKAHPQKMFVLITQPPLIESSTNAENAARARELTNWLTTSWLIENNWENKNVYVFDYFNVLTDKDNHHRIVNGEIEHITTNGDNYAYYPTSSSDSHPNAAGDQKATDEYVPLLNYFYDKWQKFLNGENIPPEFVAAPDTIVFLEDDSLFVPNSYWYDYVEDADQQKDSLRFYFSMNTYIKTNNFDNGIGITAVKDWSGIQNLVLYVSDGQATDSVKQIINVKPVNDPPVIHDLPERIELKDTTSYVLYMDNYASDVDTPDSLLIWDFSIKTDSISITYDKTKRMLTLQNNGFKGETVLTCVLADSGAIADTANIIINTSGVTKADGPSLGKIDDFYLAQNYPNPFNPITFISFYTPKFMNKVKIVIYNLNGSVIKVLYDGTLTSGRYVFKWDGTDGNYKQVASGIYIYRINSMEYSSSKKMILIR